MASVPLLLIRGINMFADGINTALALEGAKVPFNKDAYEEFSPAGGNGTIEVAVAAESLVLTFKTRGVQPELLAQCNAGFGVRKRYTFYGALVDEYADDATSRVTQVEATVVGRLNAEVDEHDAKKVTGTEYEVRSIAKYNLRIGGREICRFDIRLGGWLDAAGQRVEIAQTIGMNS